MSGRRVRIILVGVAALLVVLIAWWLLRPKPAKKPPPHKIPVVAVKAATQDFQTEITALGAAQAWTSDLILAQVSGKLIKVNFSEGSEVKAGQVLAEIDPRPFQATLTQAEGTLKRDEANLAGAQRDLERFQHLQGEGGVSRQQYEDQLATVASDQGTVEVDRGAVQAAKINLEFCRIVSPVSGRTGVRLVDPGNIVSASGSVSSVANTSSATSSAAPSTSGASTAAGANSGSSGGSGIVVVNQVQPIAVTFTVPQGEFQRLMQASDGFRKPLNVQALSQESGEVLDTGELRIVDNRVDQNTGSVELKARFPNAGPKLWPGQFVNVRLGMQKVTNAIVLPLAAINRGPNGQYVFLVTGQGKAVMQPVSVGSVQGQSVVVKSGVKPGDVIVLDGQMVLNNGSPVRISRMATAGTPAP
jgi:multidrug efflux system membrane fusion protein